MNPPRHLPSIRGSVVADRIYRATILFFALCVPVLLALIFLEVGRAGWPALRQFGFGFLTSSTLDPVNGQFGAAPAIVGTILTSVIALVIATPLALGGAIFLSEFSLGWQRQPISFLIDLLAAVPSVVFGLWGVFFLVPMLRTGLMPFLRDTLHLGATPFFSGPMYGPSVLAAGLILAIMVLPYIAGGGLRALPHHAARQRHRPTAGAPSGGGAGMTGAGADAHDAMARPRASGLARRHVLSYLMVALTCLAAAIAVVPLLVILAYLLKQGAGALSLHFFTNMPKPVGEGGAGWRTPSSARSSSSASPRRWASPSASARDCISLSSAGPASRISCVFSRMC